ncbi:MAG: helix-hairpin-helix domain-containing protein, partial [Flavobacterium sp.]
MNKGFFYFSKEQQRGILVFFFSVIVLQFGCFFIDFKTKQNLDLEGQKWLSLNSEIKALKNQQKKQSVHLYPFNPNFITDYKGYKIGMSVSQIDRLLAFRKENKYVNSAKEFQMVTGVSDSLLAVIAPYFKFPDWVKNKAMSNSVVFSNTKSTYFSKKEKIIVKDINQATQEDLIKISGIGEALSMRILKFKERLGAFVSMEQMKDIWGLSPEVVEKLNMNFKVGIVPNLKKIAINDASVKELAEFPYFKYALAREIVIYRSMNGDIKNTTDLTKIKGMSNDNATIIA